MTRRFSPAQHAASIGLGVLTMLVVGTAGQITEGAPDQRPVITRPLPEVSAPDPLLPSDIQQVRSVLGPFEAIAVDSGTPTPDTHDPAVLILNDDGSTEASSAWSVPFNSTTWSRENDFQIRGLTLDQGYATIAAANRRTYVVRATQPFVLAGSPERVLAVSADGQLFVLTMARAQALRQPL